MIRNLIFDLGNVLLPINPQATQQKLTDLMDYPFANVLTDPDEMMKKFEMGQFNYPVFFNYLSRISRKIVYANDLIPAWNAMLEPIPAHIWQFMEQISAEYDCYLLSNTNETHLAWFEDYLKRSGKLQYWKEQLFRKTYYSHEVRLRKPDPAIFYYVLNDSGINASESLYIDDLEDNVAGARVAGLHAARYDITSMELAQFVRMQIGNIS